MKLIFELLVIIELIASEVALTVWLMRRKCHKVGLIISDSLLTVVIVILTIFVFSKSPNYGDGGGQLLFIGVIYVVPPLIFSRMKIKDSIIVVMAGFTYGLLIYALSVRIAYFFDLNYFALIAFVVQSILHTLFWIIFLTFLSKYQKKTFVTVSEKIKNRALIVSLLSFLLILTFNANLTTSTNMFQKLWSVALLAAFIVVSLMLIFELWAESAQTEKLSIEIKEDQLTGLKNRTAFKHDINELIDSNRDFSLISIDLDKFKLINDTYGHLAGDQYLISFANLINTPKKEYQKVYRLAGDEFCFLTEDKVKTEEQLREIQNIDKMFADIKFLGLSYGIAEYPIDGIDANSLLQHSDAKMYDMKKKK